ncbi:MAG: S24 family peptidase [Pseudomonadota bacterium]
MTNDSLKSRVEARLKVLKINAFEAARRCKLGRDFVNDILNDKKQNVRGSSLKKLADGLDCDQAYLIGEQDEPRKSLGGSMPSAIPIIGIAEAGAFRAARQFGYEHEIDASRLYAARSERYPNARHFALEVRGDSMNAAVPSPIVEGMFVLCVDMPDAGLIPETGRIYAVRRTQDEGGTYEWTIKRAYVFQDRTELRPESTNPRHEVIVMPKRQPDEAFKTVEAIGWVYGGYHSYER